MVLDGNKIITTDEYLPNTTKKELITPSQEFCFLEQNVLFVAVLMTVVFTGYGGDADFLCDKSAM